MASFRKHHEDFIRELRAPLMSSDSLNKSAHNSSDNLSSDESDKQLIAELQKRFDELFGPDDDDE